MANRSFKKYVNEARIEDDPNAEYEVTPVSKNDTTPDRVTARLYRQLGSSWSRVARQYQAVLSLAKTLKLKQEELNSMIKAKADGVFSDSDKELTRVIETLSMIVTLRKPANVDKVTIEYQAVLDELLNEVPELKERIAELLAKYTKTEKLLKESALHVKLSKNPAEEADLTPQEAVAIINEIGLPEGVKIVPKGKGKATDAPIEEGLKLDRKSIPAAKKVLQVLSLWTKQLFVKDNWFKTKIKRIDSLIKRLHSLEAGIRESLNEGQEFYDDDVFNFDTDIQNAYDKMKDEPWIKEVISAVRNYVYTGSFVPKRSKWTDFYRGDIRTVYAGADKWTRKIIDDLPRLTDVIAYDVFVAMMEEPMLTQVKRNTGEIAPSRIRADVSPRTAEIIYRLANQLDYPGEEHNVHRTAQNLTRPQRMDVLNFARIIKIKNTNGSLLLDDIIAKATVVWIYHNIFDENIPEQFL